MNEASSIILKHVLGGFEGDPQLDKTGTRSQKLISPLDGPGVDHSHQPPVHFPTTNPFEKGFNFHVGTPVATMRTFPGSPNGIVLSAMGNAPNPMASGGNGVQSNVLNRLGQGSPNPINQNVKGAGGHSAPDLPQKGQTPAATNKVKGFSVFEDIIKHNKIHGAGGDERNVKWEQKSAIPGAETPFGSVPNLGMLRGLPGKIMSMKNSFNNLSKQQKDRIKANTSPEMYSLIEATIRDSTDVGDVERVSLGSRIHPEVFANNMVDMLSRCTNYMDLRDCMYELRSNTMMHGKDQLPTIEYKFKNAFGNTGLIIDGHGEFKQNVSPEAAKAQADFMQFITQGSEDVEVLAKFEGDITGNTLTVIHLDFGIIQKANNIYIEGPDVTDNTQIQLFGPGANGNTGIYYLTQKSNTHANNEMVLYRVTSVPEKEKPDSKGKGGGGGLGGMVGFFNTSMFGDAAKLMGQQLPVMDPKAAQAVMKNLKKVQSGQMLHRESKLSGIAMKFFPGAKQFLT